MNRAGLNNFEHVVFSDSCSARILLCNCHLRKWQLRLAMLLSHELAHAVHDHGYESLSILTTAYSSRCSEMPREADAHGRC